MHMSTAILQTTVPSTTLPTLHRMLWLSASIFLTQDGVGLCMFVETPLSAMTGRVFPSRAYAAVHPSSPRLSYKEKPFKSRWIAGPFSL